jgi:ureidoacrylate peracid hydrolase
MHKVEIPESTLKRIESLRDGLHMLNAIDPRRTAHIIVDLQNGFMAPGQPVEVPYAREIVPNVNRISGALRAASGLNVYIQYVINEASQQAWSNKFLFFATPEKQAILNACFAEGSFGWQLWPGLDVQPQDLKVQKTRFSALIADSSNLDEILRARGIDTLIITGTATNVCCESTARDAMQMNYKIIFVSDATATTSDAQHNATLANMAAMFADVMSTGELIACLQVRSGVAA